MKNFFARLCVGVICLLAILVIIIGFFTESFVSTRSAIMAIFCLISGVAFLVVDVRKE